MCVSLGFFVERESERGLCWNSFFVLFSVVIYILLSSLPHYLPSSYIRVWCHYHTRNMNRAWVTNSVFHFEREERERERDEREREFFE